MRNDFCTGYLAHSAKGKEWGRHKYVAKVKLGTGRYFYFYDWNQYQKYLKKRGDANRKAIEEKKAAVSGGSSEETAKKSMTAEERRQADIERVMGSKGSSSSKSKKSGSSSSSKDKKSSSKSSGGKSKSSTSSKEKTAKEKSSSSASKKAAKEKAEKTTKQTKTTSQQIVQEVKKTPSLSAYKYQYDLKDDDVDSYQGQDSNRISRNQIEEIIQDAVDKYPNDSSGYLLSGFTNDINYNFKWVKENGTIKLLDPDTNQEVSMDTALLNMNSVSIFRTDNKQKKS